MLLGGIQKNGEGRQEMDGQREDVIIRRREIYSADVAFIADSASSVCVSRSFYQYISDILGLPRALKRSSSSLTGRNNRYKRLTADLPTPR